MISTSEDLQVLTEDDFWRLPHDGLWEVVNGRAILLPPNENDHGWIATRGNVERTEKIDDYARAGISEYWIVNPFDRIVEVYVLREGAYYLTEGAASDPLRPQAFPGVAVDPRDIWTALD